MPASTATVVSLLNRHVAQVDPAPALLLLPPTLPLADIAPFVVAGVRRALDVRRGAGAARGVGGAAAVVAQASLVQRQARSAKLDRTSSCAVCKRRLAAGGTVGVFAVLPDGRSVHVGCV